MVTASTALVPLTASAAPKWLPSQQISSPGSASASTGAVAMSPGGASVAAYYLYDTPCCPSTRLEAVYRAPGGSYQRKQLSTPGDYAYNPDVAMDNAGNAVAVWQEQIGGHYLIRASFKPAGQNWRTPDDLSGGGQDANSPHVAMTPSGEALVTWARNNGTNYVVQAKIKPATSTTFGDLIDNISPAGAGSPDLAMASNGSAVVVWTRSNGTNSVVEGAARAAGATTFTALNQLSANGGNAYSPRVAMTPTGRATAVWYRYNGSTYAVQTGARGLTGNFTVATDISDTTNYSSFEPQVAVDSTNRAVATWYSQKISDGTYAVQAATRPANSFFATPQRISTPGTTSYSPMVALQPNGTALVTFQGYTSDGINAVQYNRLRTGANDWDGVQDLEVAQGSGVGSSSPYGPLPIATDNQGNAETIWARYVQGASSYDYSIRAAGYDAAGPTITGMSVPGGGQTGSALGMGVSATDRWSAVSSYAWNFGDGVLGGGASTSHAYSVPGTYTVTATATDAAGNASSATRGTSISSPPPPPGGGGCTDVDGDGFCAGQDCNDNNAKINPSAKEIRGNDIDENCDGLAAPLPDLSSSVLPTWSVSGSNTKAVAFLLKGLKRGWAVTASCKGRGCPFKTKKIKNKKVKRGNFNAIKQLGKKRTFKAGETLTVKFTARGYNNKFAIFKFKAGKIPSGVGKCQTKGTTRLRACR